MKKLILLIIMIISIGCYDPKLRISIYNNSNQNIEIYDKLIYKNSYKNVGYEDKFIIKYKTETNKENSCFLYYVDLEILYNDQSHNIREIYHFPNLKLQINNDKKLYLVFPNIKKFPVDQKELDKMQINGFPISPIRVECNKKIK